MQDISKKQADFARRYSDAVVAMLDSVATLADLKAEWDANGYATGSQPVGGTDWTIGDDAVQSVLPACTAAMLNSAVGAVESVRDAVTANEGYLVVMKP